jgi:hypothetical protein
MIVSVTFLSIYLVLVVWTVRVRAGRKNSYGLKESPKPAQLFMNGFVSLCRWVLAAKTAPKHRRASA